VNSFGVESGDIQMTTEARALGAEMYQRASLVSPETVNAVAAVLFALEHSMEGRLPREVAGEFAHQMMIDATQSQEPVRGRHVKSDRSVASQLSIPLEPGQAKFRNAATADVA